MPLVLALAAVAAGCGGSPKASSASTTTAPPAGGGGTAAAARAKFTSCLEAHGIPASEATQRFGFRRTPGSSTPSTATPPSTSAAFAAAFQACRSDLPTRFGNGGLQNTAAGRAYLECLQLHGVTLPSTPPSSVGGSGTGTVPGSGFRSLASNPAYQAARTACAALAPNRADGPNGSSSTSSSTAAG